MINQNNILFASGTLGAFYLGYKLLTRLKNQKQQDNKNNDQFSMCVLGSANIDYFLKVSHFPQEGETIQANEQYIKNGGKGANQAVAAAKNKGKICFAGQVGQDALSPIIIEEMQKTGLNLKYLRKVKGVQTGQAYILIDENGQNSIIIIGGANMKYDSLTQLPDEYMDAIDKSSILLMQKEIPMEINQLAAEYAKSKGKLIALDCGGRDDIIEDALLKNLDFISPNETELERLVCQKGDKIDTDYLREKFIAKYPNLKILLKLGSHGCQLITKNLDIKQQSVTQLNKQILNDYTIVDTTGAGDCFTASFFVRLNELKDNQSLDLTEMYRNCMNFANSSAFLCITKSGAMPSMPSREDVDEFIQKYL